MYRTIAYTFAALLVTIAIVEPTDAQTARATVQAVQARLVPNKQFPDDLILTGQVTDSTGTQPFRITIKGKDQARYEVGSGSAMTAMTLIKGVGWMERAGKVEVLPPHVAIRRPAIVPFLDLLAEADTPALQITDKGTVSIGTILTRQFNLKLPDPTPSIRMFRQALDEESDMFVDLQSLLVVRTESWVAADNSMEARARSILEFSDYRTLGGLSIPFQVRHTISLPGARTTPILYVIQNVLINSGVPGSLFVAQGGSQ